MLTLIGSQVKQSHVRHTHMADNVASECDVSDDVSAVASPSRRSLDFSISSLLSSKDKAPTSTHDDDRYGSSQQRNNLPDDWLARVTLPGDRYPHHNSPDAHLDSSAVLRQRLATAALWYPWLHSVASLQSAAGKHHLTDHCKLFCFVTLSFV